MKKEVFWCLVNLPCGVEEDMKDSIDKAVELNLPEYLVKYLKEHSTQPPQDEIITSLEKYYDVSIIKVASSY